jgi:hypothetical protein
MVQEADNRPYGKAQEKDAGGIGRGIYGTHKSKCPYPDLAWLQKSRSVVLFSGGVGSRANKKEGRSKPASSLCHFQSLNRSSIASFIAASRLFYKIAII